MSPDPDAALVSLTEAAEHLGVHYMTAYRYVRTGRMLAEKQGGQWWVSRQELEAVSTAGTGVRPPDGTRRALTVEPMVARLIAGDTSGCWDAISDALASGAAPVEVHQSLQNALQVIGQRWHDGLLTIADEHRATATTSRLLGQMGPLFRHRGRRKGTVVIGVCADDFHALASAFLADLLSDRHFDVIDLGGNTPSSSFVSAASSVDDLVGIGICAALDQSIRVVQRQVGEIRAALPDAFLLVGGPPFARVDAADFGPLVDAISTTSEQACDAFELPLGVPAKI